MEQRRMEQVPIAALRQIITTYFSDSELRDLCFDLSIDYENLSGQGKGDKVRELVAYVKRHGQGAELFKEVCRLRPTVNWSDVEQPVPPEWLREVPSVIATVHERYYNEFTEQRQKVLDELRRVESANQDWITSTRNFHFQRLLQAIKEVEYPAGRLEANRAFNLALQKSGAVNRPTEQNLLRICDELDSNSLFLLNWKLRRMISRVVGDIIGLQLEKHDQRLIGHFCDSRLCTPEGVLLLAEAGSEHTAAAQAIGASILRRLLLSSQPQVPWQLLRRWPRVSPVVSDEVDLNEIREVSNTGIRRMLFLAQLQRIRFSQRKLKQFLRSVSKSVGDEPGDFVRFQDALMVWSSLNTSVDMHTRSVGSRSFFRIHEILQAASSSSQDYGDLIIHIAQAMELDSLERDLRNMEGTYDPHPSEKYSEGRYSYTRHYVRWAFHVIPRDKISALLLELLNCTDEGIRWAVAAEVLKWWMFVPDADAAMQIVLRLVSDKHPWVVREVLQQLSTDPLLCQTIGIERLNRHSGESKRRIEAEGWISNELVAATRRIAALDPRQWY